MDGCMCIILWKRVPESMCNYFCQGKRIDRDFSHLAIDAPPSTAIDNAPFVLNDSTGNTQEYRVTDYIC